MAHVVAAGLLIALVGAYIATIVHRRGVLTEAADDRPVEDPAELGLSPAVCGWVLRGFRVTAEDFVATLLDLVWRRVIELGVSSDASDTGWVPLAGVPEAAVDESNFVLVMRPERATDLAPHEEVLVRLLFRYAAGGRDAVSLRAVRTFAHHRSAEYAAALQVFAGAIEQAADWSGVYRPNPLVLWPVFTPLALVLGLCGTLVTGSILYLAAGVVLGILSIVDTRRAVVPGSSSRDAYRGCVALRRHLLSVGRMGEKPAASVEIWGRYLAYAAAFGIADRVESTLEVPRSFVTGAYALGLISPFDDPVLIPPDESAVDVLANFVEESGSSPEHDGPAIPLHPMQWSSEQDERP